MLCCMEAMHEPAQDPAQNSAQQSETQAATNSAGKRSVTHHARKARHAVRRHPVTRVVWQVVVGVVGLGLLVAGAAMLVLPGPGWAVLALGLVVLASEFVWFERPLRPVRRVLDRAGVTNGSPRRKALAIGIGVLATLGTTVAWVWAQRNGVELPSFGFTRD
ncbi:MAG: hypothetical protein RL745_648 [Actinomycetota bacterium]